MRSISPVVAIVVLMVMTVAAAGMAYLTIVSYQEEVESGTGSSLEELAASGMSSIKVESLADGKLYIRSHGNPCEGLMIQVGSQAPEELGDCNTDSTLTAFDLTSQCPEGVTGQVTMKITGSHGISSVQSIQCTDLGEEEGGAGAGQCDNIEAHYRQDSQYFDNAGTLDQYFYIGHNYTAPAGSVVRKVDVYLPYANSSGGNGTGNVNVFITDNSIYSTDPSTLTPDGSIFVQNSTQNKWVSVDLNEPVSGEFFVIVNLENTTDWSGSTMPFGMNFTMENSSLICQSGNPAFDCADGIDKYEELAPTSVVFSMMVHISTSATYGTFCDDGYFCDSGSCSWFLQDVPLGTPASCGDATCDPGEDSSNCCDDCGCGSQATCTANTCSCDSGYQDCNGDGTGSDTNGCECSTNNCCVGNTCGYCQVLTFSDGSSSKTLRFMSSGSDNSTKLKINASATISSATLNLIGLVSSGIDSEFNSSISTPGGDYFGSSISSGDINNDGYIDMLVGSVGDGFSEKGRVYVFWGNESGDYDSSRSYAIVGEVVNDKFGISVFSGDINNDGYDDVLVGANSYPTGGSLEGRVYIFWGNETDDFNYANNYTITGEHSSDNLGFSISAGDLNNDGYDEFLVGAWGFDIQRGRVFVFWGNTTGNFTNTSRYIINGTDTNDHMGRSVSSGDVNNDNYMDLIVGSDYGGGLGAETVYVFWGNTTGNFTYANNYTITEATDMGWSVYSGDINGDSYADVLAGGLNDKVYLFWGNETDDFNSTRNYTFSGPSGFGDTVSAGDLNKDGYDELFVTSTEYLPNGRVFIFWGNQTDDFTYTDNYTIDANATDDRLLCTHSIDINNDGYGELIVGADRASGGGKVYFFWSGIKNITDPALKPGSDAGTSWSHGGVFTSTETADIETELTSILPACTCYGCSLASGECTIDLNMTSDTLGRIQLDTLIVNYTLS